MNIPWKLQTGRKTPRGERWPSTLSGAIRPGKQWFPAFVLEHGLGLQGACCGQGIGIPQCSQEGLQGRNCGVIALADCRGLCGWLSDFSFPGMVGWTGDNSQRLGNSAPAPTLVGLMHKPTSQRGKIWISSEVFRNCFIILIWYIPIHLILISPDSNTFWPDSACLLWQSLTFVASWAV